MYWHASIFAKEGICIYPKHSLVKNIGFDGSGRMSSKDKYTSILKQNVEHFKINYEIAKNINLIDDEFNYYIKRKSIIGKLLVYFKKIYFIIF